MRKTAMVSKNVNFGPTNPGLPCIHWIKFISEISQNENCEENLGTSSIDGIQIIKTYPLHSADKYLNDLTPTSHPELLFKDSDKKTVELPVVVSAASSNHMYEVEAMFHNLNNVVRKVYPTIWVFFYYLGLTESDKLNVSWR